MDVAEMDVAEEQPSTSGQKRRATDELELEEGGEFRHFGHYMKCKVIKLGHQVHDNVELKSRLFDGVAIYVNGYTDPPALTLRHLITEHGGQYHHYFSRSKTTYQIAVQMSASRWKTLSKDIIVLRPEWVTKSIECMTRLPIDGFVLTPLNQGLRPLQPAPAARPPPRVPSPIVEPVEEEQEEAEADIFLDLDSQDEDNGQPEEQNEPQPSTSTRPPAPTVWPPHQKLPVLKPPAPVRGKMAGGVDAFYQRSRLHLISTLAQDMRKFVCEMRSKADGHVFKSRERENFRKEPVIVHIDMDCFFVSIALRTRPELRRKPVVITHSKSANNRAFAEIASCSYEARRFKISNGMWMREAVKRCPNLVCLPYQFDDYRETSKQLYTIIGQYTLDIKAVSCDELYFDLAPLCEELKIVNPLDVITEMRKEIFEATGCPASAGLGKCFPLRPLLIPLAAGPSPLMARLATRKAKPNGQHHVRQELVGEFMKRVPLTAIPGVGPALITKLAGRFGAVQTCQQLYDRSMREVQEVLGKNQGKKFFETIRGIADPRLELTDSSTRKSISCDVNFGVRLQTEADFHEFLLDIAKQLAKKLHDASLKGSTLTMKLLIRHPDAPLEPEKYGAHGWCNSISKSIPFMKPSDDPKVLHNEAKRLGKMMQPPIADIRGIGLQMTQLLSIHDPMANRSRAFAILKPDKKRARLDKKYGLREGQRYVQKRTIERLPPRRHECICGGDHEMAVNLERMPSFKTVAALRCFFHQLVQEADFAALNAHFRAIMEGIERAAHLADSRWTDVMRYLLRDINLRAWKLYQYLVLRWKFD